MRDRLKMNCKILRCKICVAWFNFLLYVALPLLKYVCYVVIFVTTPLWLPIYLLVEGKRIKRKLAKEEAEQAVKEREQSDR